MRHVIAVLALAAAGCATAGGPRDPMATPIEPPPMLEETGDGYTFRLSRDDGVAVAMVDGRPADVFQALLGAYETLGLGIGGADQRRFLVQAQPKAAVRTHAGERLSRLFNCGATITGDRADAWRLQIETSSQASAAGDSTRLTTRVSAIARPLDGSSTNAVPCSTQGRLEQKIAEATAQRLKSGS